MFDSLLGGKFSNKCKYYVKCVYSRLSVIKKKKQATVKFLKKDIADLLAQHLDENAFRRIEPLIVEINHASCYDMIEQYCQDILKQLPCLQKKRECPEEAAEAVSTLIFAAARVPDLPELSDLRKLFVERYGSQIEKSVNTEFVEKMQKKSFSVDTKLQFMQAIADEFSVEWDFSRFQQGTSKSPALASDQSKKQNGSNMRRSLTEMNGRNTAVNERQDAVYDIGPADYDRKAAFFNAGPAVYDRKGVVASADGAVNGRKAPAFDVHVATNRKKESASNANAPISRNNNEVELRADAMVSRRKETAVSARLEREISPKERWEHTPRIFKQKQVQPEPTDIHVVTPRIFRSQSDDTAEKIRDVPISAEKMETLEVSYKGGAPYNKPKGSLVGNHDDDRIHDGGARNRLPITREGPGLIGIEKQTADPLTSKDVKAIKMVSPYTKLKGSGDANRIIDPLGVEVRKDHVLNSIAQDVRHINPVSSKDGKLINMIPPYTKPGFKNPSPLVADRELIDVPVNKSNSSSGADYERSNGEEKLIPVSVRRKHPKPPLATEIDITIDDGKPAGLSSTGRTKERRCINEDLYAVETEGQYQRKAAAALNGDIGHDQRVRRASSDQRRHGARRSNANYDGDCDEEERAMDRLLFHYSKKGVDESSKTRTRTGTTPATTKQVHHRPERVASLPKEPMSPTVENGDSVGKLPVRAVSLHRAMLSPNGASSHPIVPDYDDLAARFIALKKV